MASRHNNRHGRLSARNWCTAASASFLRRIRSVAALRRPSTNPHAHGHDLAEVIGTVHSHTAQLVGRRSPWSNDALLIAHKVPQLLVDGVRRAFRPKGHPLECQPGQQAPSLSSLINSISPHRQTQTTENTILMCTWLASRCSSAKQGAHSSGTSFHGLSGLDVGTSRIRILTGAQRQQ